MNLDCKIQKCSIATVQWLIIYYYPVQLYLLVYNFLSFAHKYIKDKTINEKLKVSKVMMKPLLNFEQIFCFCSFLETQAFLE